MHFCFSFCFRNEIPAVFKSCQCSALGAAPCFYRTSAFRLLLQFDLGLKIESFPGLTDFTRVLRFQDDALKPSVFVD